MFAHDYLLWSVAAISIFCAGCATSKGPAFNYAPEAEDQAAKELIVPEGKSVIYVFAYHHNRLQTIIQVDQRDVCRLAKRTYYKAVLESGQHQLGIRCEGNWDDGTPFSNWKRTCYKCGTEPRLFLYGSGERIGGAWGISLNGGSVTGQC